MSEPNIPNNFFLKQEQKQVFINHREIGFIGAVFNPLLNFIISFGLIAFGITAIYSILSGRVEINLKLIPLSIVSVLLIVMGWAVFRQHEEQDVYFLGVPVLKITATHLIFYRNIFPFYKKSIVLDEINQYSIHTQKLPWRVFYRIKIYTQDKEALLNFYFLDKKEVQEALDSIQLLSTRSFNSKKSTQPTSVSNVSKIIIQSNSENLIDIDYWRFNLNMILIFYLVTSPILILKIFNFSALTLPLAPYELLSRFWIFILIPLVILNVPRFDLFPELKALILTLFSTKTTITPQQIIIKKTKFPFIRKTVIPKEEIGLLQQHEDKTQKNIEIIKTSGEHVLLPIGKHSLQEVENVLYSESENNILEDKSLDKE